MLYKCPSCGRELDENAPICPGCGRPDAGNDAYNKHKEDKRERDSDPPDGFCLVVWMMFLCIIIYSIIGGCREFFRV